jgi:hypothetical protein
MDKMKLEQWIDEGLSTRRIAYMAGTSQTNVRYWLKAHGLRTQAATKPPVDNEICSLCGKKQNPKIDRYRKKCSACYVKIRRERIRRAAFIYKGGACETCGRSDGPLCAYDFHHREGSKEFAISHAHSASGARIRAELDKCSLLCAFCHRVAHAFDPSDELLEAVRGKVIVF